MNKQLTIGIRYCGGCNPTYERGEVVRELQRRFPEVMVQPVKSGETYDLLAIIRGCRRPCAGRDDLPGRYGSVIVSDEAEAEYLHLRVQELLRSLKEECVDELEADLPVKTDGCPDRSEAY